MKHYIYRIDNDFGIVRVKAASAKTARKIVKEVTGTPACNQKIISKEYLENEPRWYMEHTEYLGYENAMFL